MKEASPVYTDIVLVGGGHSHVAVLKRFGMRPAPGIRLSLVARDVLTPYSGMLPGLVAGHYTHAEAHIDLRRLCAFAGARLFHTSATGIDLARREIVCVDRPNVPYDILSLDVGSTPTLDRISGAAEHALGVKPVDAFLARWPEIEAKCRARQGALRLVVIGGGAGGVELCLSVQHRLGVMLEQAGISARPALTVVSETPELLPTHAATVRRRLTAVMRERGVDVRLGERVEAVGDGWVRTQTGVDIGCDVVIAVTHASAPQWLLASGLALDDSGFVRVQSTLQSVSHPEVFATGDVAALVDHRLAKSGVYAVRQGPVLAENLLRQATRRRLRRYRPQSRTLALISSGDPRAVASYANWSVQGAWVWKIKDWIDRRWMRRYQVLPSMHGSGAGFGDGPGDGAVENAARRGLSGEPIGAFDMRCGGCGSKVASPVLRRVLARIGTEAHPDVVVGLHNADDAAVIEIPPNRLLVQSVDHFRTFIDDPYVFARVTANHCLSDLFAMGATPHTAQVMVSLPFGPEEKVEQDLYLVLAGVCEALSEAGGVLVGGHTAEGPELSLGLAVNGLLNGERLLTKEGMVPGQALILTKGLGTGVIFAADMRARASAVAVDEALRSMLRSNGPAARCLSLQGAGACTDITGFGLAGHLVEMLRASAVDAALALEALPYLQGARGLLEQGFRSSLHAGNSVFAGQLDAPDGCDAAALAKRWPILFDPQTSGGLLASVPAESAEACLRELRSLGYEHAAQIGNVVPAREGYAERGRIRAGSA